MLPGDGRNVFEQMTGNGPALALQRIDDAGEVDGIPVNDRTDHEIEAGGAKGLAVEGAVAEGVEQTLGRSGSDTHLTGVQASIHDSGSHLEDAVGALR